MVAFFITGSARSWRAIAARGPVRQNYPLVTSRWYSYLGSMSSYWASWSFSFLKQILFSCINIVPPHLYKNIAFVNSQLITVRVLMQKSLKPSSQFWWLDIPSSCKSLKYLWVDVLYHHFKIFSLRWGNVFIQPWISEISKIFSIRTRASSLSSLSLNLSSKLGL